MPIGADLFGRKLCRLHLWLISIVSLLLEAFQSSLVLLGLQMIPNRFSIAIWIKAIKLSSADLAEYIIQLEGDLLASFVVLKVLLIDVNVHVSDHADDVGELAHQRLDLCETLCLGQVDGLLASGHFVLQRVPMGGKFVVEKRQLHVAVLARQRLILVQHNEVGELLVGENGLTMGFFFCFLFHCFWFW